MLRGYLHYSLNEAWIQPLLELSKQTRPITHHRHWSDNAPFLNHSRKRGAALLRTYSLPNKSLIDCFVFFQKSFSKMWKILPVNFKWIDELSGDHRVLLFYEGNKVNDKLSLKMINIVILLFTSCPWVGHAPMAEWSKALPLTTWGLSPMWACPNVWVVKGIATDCLRSLTNVGLS